MQHRLQRHHLKEFSRVLYDRVLFAYVLAIHQIHVVGLALNPNNPGRRSLKAQNSQPTTMLLVVTNLLC